MLKASDRMRRSRLVLFALLALAGLPAGATASVAPPGRAYEMVSPADKGGNDVSAGTMQATPSGDAIAFGASAAYAGAPTSLLGGTDVATRGADWTTKSLDVAQGSAPGLVISSVALNSADLRTSLVASSAALAPGAVEGDGNVYLRDNASGALTFVGTSPDRLFGQLFLFLGSPVSGASADLSHIVFDTDAALLGDAVAGGPNSYEFADGRLRLVGVLPDGAVAADGARTNVTTHDPHVVSADGRRVYFTRQEFTEAPLYLREDGTRTIPISASRIPGDAGTEYPATFGGASADGDIAYFTSMNPLTPASSTTANTPTLYRYRRSDDSLTDLTPNAGGTGANVTAILQVSDDGAYVWLTSTSVLAAGGTDGNPNLYVWHDGTLRFEAALGTFEFAGPGTWSMSPDGHLLAFSTEAAPPGYDNTSAACAASATGACAEVQLADASAAGIARCVSCRPDGATARGAAQVGGGTNSTLGRYWPRAVLDDGRVFFESPDRLVPEDTNGKVDVYQWAGDHASLISTGRSEDDSTFGDASADGGSVFFRTTERLVARDADRNVDVYVARVGGGIAAQDEVDATTPCAGEACRPAPTAPPGSAPPSSATFQGPGDPPVPAAAPVARFTVATPTRAQRARLAKTGRLALAVEVTRAGTVTVTARATVRGHVATVARGGATARRAGTATVALTLSRATRRALSARRHPALTLHVSYGPAHESKTIKVTL